MERTITLTTTTGAKTVQYTVWDGQQLCWHPEVPLGLDTETELITDERVIPRLALATASDGKSHVVIHPECLARFLLQHRDAHFVAHNAQFDFWVIDRHLGDRGEIEACRVLWDACHEGRLHDTMILDMLIQLATGRYRNVSGSRSGEDEAAKVYPGNLAAIAADYTTMRLSKDDPYRLRFGELVALSAAEWEHVDPQFFAYAVPDAIAVQRLYPAMAEVAYGLMCAHGFDRQATRYDIWPDALQRFGYLSETVQVKASVVLAHMFRQGVHVDQQGVRELSLQYGKQLENLIETLKRDYPQVLSFKKDGSLKLTPKGGTPSLANAKLFAMLEQVADEIRNDGHEITIPQSSGKNPGISKKIKKWTPYQDWHPFIRIWAELKRLEKLQGFLAGLDVPVLHCYYSLLTRTGRTACSQNKKSKLPGANLQQMPKASEFRRLFVAPAVDQTLYIGDYSAIELRTLAAVCRARYGYSKLAEVIEQGVDPHAFTAAAIQNLSLEEFLALKKVDAERFRHGRQASKAINFGVPGGLGASALQSYAKINYGVTLTLEEAEAFRRRLITDIYPELNDRDGYLSDPGMSSLAKHLGVQEWQVWEILDRSGTKNPIAARGVANVIRGVSKAQPAIPAVGLERPGTIGEDGSVCP